MIALQKLVSHAQRRREGGAKLWLIACALFGAFIGVLLSAILVVAPIAYVASKVTKVPVISQAFDAACDSDGGSLLGGIGGALPGVDAAFKIGGAIVRTTAGDLCEVSDSQQALLDKAEESGLSDAIRAYFDCANRAEADRRAGQCDPNALGDGEQSAIPPEKGWLIPIYVEAGREHKVPWQLIAAVHGARSNFGERNCSKDGKSGGLGNFSRKEWAEFGKDVGHSSAAVPSSDDEDCYDLLTVAETTEILGTADEMRSGARDGVADPRDPVDAIYAQAAILAANGAYGRKDWDDYNGDPAAGCSVDEALDGEITPAPGAAGTDVDNPGGGTPLAPGAKVADIPSEYLGLYVAAGQEYSIDWAVLAGIGKVETDHGRSTAQGVSSGQNFHGCCAGPMQFYNNRAMAGGTTTWDAYGVDGNGDGKKDVYDPADAIPAAAKYLVAAGAPDDYDKAIFAYNHAGWYVQKVKDQAQAYRDAAKSAGVDPSAPIAAGGDLVETPATGRKVNISATVISGGAEHADAAIVPSAVAVALQHKMKVTDGWRYPSEPEYKASSNHSCGLAIDYVGTATQMRQLEAWAKRMGFPEVLGPESDPQGHGDHTHIAFGTCATKKAVILASAGAGQGSGTTVPGAPSGSDPGADTPSSSSGASSVDAIRRYLTRTRPDSPLIGQVPVLVEEATKGGIDPRIIFAIAGSETSFGTTGNAAAINNAWGLGPHNDYRSWREGGAALVRTLRNYADERNASTIAEIQKIYAPSGASNDPGNLNTNWVRNVSLFYTQMGGDPTKSVTNGDGGGSDSGSSPGAGSGSGTFSGKVPTDPVSKAVAKRYGEKEPHSACYVAHVHGWYTAILEGVAASSGGSPGTGNADLDAFMTIIRAQLGKPYIWGASGADSFDCSGLPSFAFREIGKPLPGGGRWVTWTFDEAAKKYPDTWEEGTDWSQVRVGDFIMANNVNHMVIYAGEDKFIHASGGQACPASSSRCRVVEDSNFSGYSSRIKWVRYKPFWAGGDGSGAGSGGGGKGVVWVQSGHEPDAQGRLEPGYGSQTGAPGEAAFNKDISTRVVKLLRDKGIDARRQVGRVEPMGASGDAFVSIHHDVSGSAGRGFVGFAVAGTGENYYAGDGTGAPSDRPIKGAVAHRGPATTVDGTTEQRSRSLAQKVATRLGALNPPGWQGLGDPQSASDRRAMRYYGFYRTKADARILIEVARGGTSFTAQKRPQIAQAIADGIYDHVKG